MVAPSRRHHHHRLRAKVKHLVSTMLCCGRRKESRQSAEMASTSPRRARASNTAPPEMVVQSDFRKVSGISTEIFNQLQAVENDHDDTTAASLEAVERRGEMVIRLLDVRAMGKLAAEAAKRFLSPDPNYGAVHFVEIVKRPGQTLGLYIREGNGADRADGVFVSRIALESAVYNSGCLRVGDEILAVNFVDVTCMSLDDVVIVMSIPRRLVLTTRTCKAARGVASPPLKPAEQKGPPVVVFKKELDDDDRPRHTTYAPDFLYYNSQPPPPPPPKLRSLPVVAEQPRPAYPKTLESLAEKVHAFHGTPCRLQPCRSERSLVRRGSVQGPRSEAAATRRGRLLRAESDQRISLAAERSRRDELPPHWSRAPRASLKPPSMQGTYERHRAGSRYAQTLRLSALRRRAATDSSCSDTEVVTLVPRSYTAALLDRQCSLERAARFQAQGRSNSLPRMRLDDQQQRRPPRPVVHFERHQHDSQEDSDGAVSAPELPVVRRSDYGRMRSSPSVFTAAEYRAWISRAPSTSVIYERLRRGGDPLAAQRAARFTYSAENLSERLMEEQRAHAARSLPRAVLPPSQRFRLMLDDGRSIPHPSPAKPSESRLRLLDINPAEFLKYKAERESSTGLGGLLWVHLLAGRGLRSAAARTEHYRDLYCVLECDRVHKARTVVRTGDQNFDWDETFELDLVDNKELDFLVYSWDPQFRHKLCCRGSIALATLLHDSRYHQVALKVEPRGTLYLKLRYAEPRHVFKRAPAAKKGALFGTDLETVVAREALGVSVPVIVKRCVEEVERRGLDIIGLYRLCGSASKKRLLREAFERNPLPVDLSPDNVPDINVITGVLKDYLRELPEPLFTQCLYQMMVDALAVCLPDDPSGNAKLMFSIFECLPKVNRCTLVMLMDHLKLVVSQSERNKMTAQNIAICFGPVLFVQTASSLADNVVDFQRPIEVLKYLLDIWPTKCAGQAV